MAAPAERDKVPVPGGCLHVAGLDADAAGPVSLPAAPRTGPGKGERPGAPEGDRAVQSSRLEWQGPDLNWRPLGYEPIGASLSTGCLLGRDLLRRLDARREQQLTEQAGPPRFCLHTASVRPDELVGDADRDAVLALLKERHATGHLNLNAYDQRATAALAAETRAQLAGVLRDLPA